MPWSADTAARELWSGLDKGASNGEALAYFRKHLQHAYDAGAQGETLAIKDVIAKLRDGRRTHWTDKDGNPRVTDE